MTGYGGSACQNTSPAFKTQETGGALICLDLQVRTMLRSLANQGDTGW